MKKIWAYLIIIALFVFSYSLSMVVPFLAPAITGVIVGILWSSFYKNRRHQEIFALIEKKTLAWAIALMGVGLSVDHILKEVLALLPIFALIPLSVGMTAFLGQKFFKLPKTLGQLMGYGLGICGASAVAALGPFVTKDRKEIAVSAIMVQLVSTLGLLFVFLFVATLRGWPEVTPWLIGGTLSSVGHVGAGAYLFGEAIAEKALLIKLARVSCLPLALVYLGLNNLRKVGQAKKKITGRVLLETIPMYLWFFMLMVILSSWGVVPAAAITKVKIVVKVLMAFALLAIGLNTRLQDLRDCFKASGALALMVFGFQICYVIIIYNYFV